MGTLPVLAALFSALLHAGWNAGVKASPRPAEAMTGQMVAGAAIGLPLLFWLGLPPLAAWPWMLASTAINTVTVTTLLRAYSLGGFGVVYPVGRAVSVLLVVPLSTWLAGDTMHAPALAGVLMIVAALTLLAKSASTDRSFTPRAMAWTLAAGLCTAVYVLCDARGVRAAGSAWSYGLTVSITNALAMAWRQRGVGNPWRILQRNAAVSIPAAIASMASYLLILWVYSAAPIAAGSALRDTSAIFALLIAIIWLREPLTKRRVIAVLLATAAVPLLRLA
jgi:drug/metabolite transporter (DMT)-like permease